MRSIQFWKLSGHEEMKTYNLQWTYGIQKIYEVINLKYADFKENMYWVNYFARYEK